MQRRPPGTASARPIFGDHAAARQEVQVAEPGRGHIDTKIIGAVRALSGKARDERDQITRASHRGRAKKMPLPGDAGLNVTA
jgi:hypothetical protein